MNWFKLWVIRPIYWLLFVVAAFVSNFAVAMFFISLYEGRSLMEIYELLKPGANLIAMSYLAGYWIKWEFVETRVKRKEI